VVPNGLDGRYSSVVQPIGGLYVCSDFNLVSCMESNKPLARAGYLIAALLVIIPLYDAMAALWPPHLGDERWRFGAVGTFSNLTLVPLLGFLLCLFIASAFDQRRVRRFVGIVCAILGILLAATAVLFVLDYFQTRTLVNPKFQQAMGVATTTAIVKLVLSIIALALLSRAGFAGPKAAARKKVVVTEPSKSPLLPVSGAARAE
jgi:MFS family permease